MAVKIRLKRLGKIRAPYYRIVVTDSRKKRDGRVIEEVGKYHPTEEPSFIEVTSDRVQYWLGVGAQPSEAVQRILEITGDWQTFKGLEGTEGTLKVKEKKVDVSAAIEAAESEAEKKKAAKTRAEKDAGKDKAQDKPAEPAADAAADADASPAPGDEPAEAPAGDKPAE